MSPTTIVSKLDAAATSVKDNDQEKRPQQTYSASNESTPKRDDAALPDDVQATGSRSKISNSVGVVSVSDSSDKEVRIDVRQTSCSKSDKIDLKDNPSEKPASTKKNSTNTLSRFKEKRPEPLRLNPNLNQETPLDLSVKSAGNVPSGTLSSIFNLIPNSHMTTLETPRIQWQDNDALLTSVKNPSFSSSTNASQRSRISSLIGESPPMTPGSPMIDMMIASSKIRQKSSNSPHSASFMMDSTDLPSTDPAVDSDKSQIHDKWSHLGRLQLCQSKDDSFSAPRRSCSTDNLNMNTGANSQTKTEKSVELRIRQDGEVPKKTSVSQLATKSQSITNNQSLSRTKFSYSNHQIVTNHTDTQRSPTLDGSGKSPNSVTNATANLLNIHLNSPIRVNSKSPVSPVFDVGNSRSQPKTSIFAPLDHESNPMDPLISATFCQQQQSQGTRPSVNFSTPSSGMGDHNNCQPNTLLQHHNLSSVSSSATLNTPTLISPNHVKGGSLCFLPSPTLSPMSSVFDLPSPFLVFPPSSTNHQNISNGSSKQSSPRSITNMMDVTFDIDANSTRKHDNSLSNSYQRACDAADINQSVSKNSKINDSVQATHDEVSNSPKNDTKLMNTEIHPQVSRDLSHLITSANGKVMTPSRSRMLNDVKDDEDEVDMDVDLDIVKTSEDIHLKEYDGNHLRPATVIPQICIADHQAENDLCSPTTFCNKLSSEEGIFSRYQENRESANKLTLSPRSFNVKVRSYRSDRLESSSAPPGIEQPWFRAKIKTVTTYSCYNLDQRNDLDIQESNRNSNLRNRVSTRPDNDSIRSQQNIDQPPRSTKPYPELRGLFPSTSHHLLHSHDQIDRRYATLTTRSSSAEPTIYTKIIANRVQCESFKNNAENVLSDCYQQDERPQPEANISHSAQQLYCVPRSEIQRDICSSDQPITAKQRQNDGNIQQNLQSPIQNCTIYNYYQQQHSMSAGELHKIQNQPNHPSVATTNGIEAGGGQYPGTQRESIAQPNPSLTHPHFSQQSISSSLTRVDCISGNYQQTPVDHRHQQPGPMITDPATIRHANNQTSVMNLLCNSDSCQQQISHINPLQRHGSNPLTSLQYSTDTSTNVKLPSNLHYPYQIDIESRSDSRSSSSLEFSSPYIGSGSRPNSATSSNLASKKYHCDMCSKSFTRSDMLTRHKRLHSGDRPFQCRECKQEFSRSDHLSTHMRTHTGEKPYKCKLCSYSACRKDMITRHLKVHSRNPDVVEFV